MKKHKNCSWDTSENLVLFLLFFYEKENKIMSVLSDLRLLFADYAMDIQLPKNIPKYREKFKNVSCSKWAVNELQMYILRKQPQMPIISVKEFIKMMDNFVKKSKEEDEPIFFIAKAVAIDILDIFNAMS